MESKDLGGEPTFKSLDKLTSGIHYIQAAIASISSLLLLIGLASATTNLLTKDWLFGSWPWVQYAWAGTQAIAVDANLAMVGMVFFSAIEKRDWVRAGVYGLIGGMLLFVAAVIMDIESVRQALNVSLAEASTRVHVSLELLTQLRSWVVAALVFSARITVSVFQAATSKPGVSPPPVKDEPIAPPQSLSSDQVEPSKPATNGTGDPLVENHQVIDTYQKYLALVALTPNATRPWLAEKLGVHQSTISNYRRKSKNEHDELTILHPTPAEANA